MEKNITQTTKTPPGTEREGNHNQQDKQKKKDNAEFTYTTTSIVGTGSFGIVYKATVVETGEVVAIKKVFQDQRYKNRELQVMQELHHPNCINLKNFFFTPSEKPDEVYLNCVMDFIPENLGSIVRGYYKAKQQMNMIFVKLYSFQMLKALAYIHALGLCHRDIKPQNILINQTTHELKLCDFGCAKRIVKGQPNLSYICSRYYRAPELIFGATDYTGQIDVWSIGCVIAELVLGRPVFPGETASDQLVEIIKILGTPTNQQIYQMNHNYKEHKFPSIKPYPWTKVFKNRRVTPDYLDLISKLLVYEPLLRLTPMQALCHPFFNELREKDIKLPNGDSLPKDLFEFSKEEIDSDPKSAAILMGKAI